MNPSLRQLKAFLAVARTASFTKAAEQLHVSQAGLSAMIKELEGQTGCRLFYRTTRLVELTPQGMAFLPHAESAVLSMEASRRAIGMVAGDTRQRLRIGVTPLIANSLLPGALRQLRDEAPGLHVELVDTERERIEAMVDTGAIDAGYGLFFKAVSGIHRKALFATKLVRLVAAGDGSAQRRPVRWKELDGAALVTLPAHNPIQAVVDQRLRDAGVRIVERMEVTHLETVIAMAAQGFGQAVLPSLCAGAAARYPVQLDPLTPAGDTLDYYCITKAGRPRGAEAVRLGQLIGAQLDAMPPPRRSRAAG